MPRLTRRPRAIRPPEPTWNGKLIRLMSDEELESAIDTPDDAPHQRQTQPVEKKAVKLTLDADLIEWFRRQGRDYQERINAALRAHVANADAESGTAR